MQAFELVNAVSTVVSAVAAVVSTVVAVVTLSVQRKQAADAQQLPEQDDVPPGADLPGWKRMSIGTLCPSPG